MSARPASPFKGLSAFADTPLDAQLFFGREREREAIVANLLASRLTVLYGPSGVGKSSLLRAGVAQRLRTADGAAVVVHDSWVDDPVAGLVASIRAACPGLGPTAGLVDTLAAAAQAQGEAYLLLDQFEEYFLYHGADAPLATELPELLRRPGLRANVLIALRDDALAALDAFAGGVPDLFGNLLRLDRLDRRAAREAIVGPLALHGDDAEPGLVDAVLDEVGVGRVDLGGDGELVETPERVEAPFLQLVLERLWAAERASGSRRLRLGTLRGLGGAETIVREHVHGALEALPVERQSVAARLIRQLVTPSGTKVAHTLDDLAAYTDLTGTELRQLLATLAHDRLVRSVDGAGSGQSRYEIFHDVLAAPLLAWRGGFELRRERERARRQRRRLLRLTAAALAALLVVAAVAIFALVQRGEARSQARRAHGRELAAQALAGLPADPAKSLALALRAAELAPGPDTEAVLRSSLLAMREERVVRTGGRVVAASFAPAGERLLVAGSDGSLGLYDAGGARLPGLPRVGPLTRAAWSPDGRLLATGGESGLVTVRRASDGRTLRTLRLAAPVAALEFAGRSLLAAAGGRVAIAAPGGQSRLRLSGAVAAAALAPGARLAISFRRQGRVTTELVDAGTGRVRRVLPERGVDALAFSPDRRLLATGSTDDTARLWDAATGRLLHVLPHRGHVLAVRFSSDGRRLVTSSADGTAAVWRVATGDRDLLLVGATGAAEDAAFSPDGKEIAVAFADRLARIYDGDDGRLLAPLAGHAETVTSVGFDPAGRAVVTGSDDGTARLWNAAAGGELRVVDRRPHSVVTLPAGGGVLTVAGREARLVDLNGRVLRRIRLRSQIVAAAADGVSIALAGTAGELALGSRTIRGLGVTALAYTPDGTLVTGSRDGRLRVWRGSGAPRELEPARGPVASLSAGGARVAVRTETGAVAVYSLAGGLLRRLPGRADRATLSPAGDLVATARGREVRLRDAAGGRLLHALAGHRSLVTDVEFSPDGTRLVTASDDHDARVWDVATGRLVHVLRGHFFAVRTASFSPDGRWIVTSSQFTAGLWNAGTGALVLYLRGHTRPLTGASFAPDGRTIVTGGDDGTAGVYACDICRPLAGLEAVARERLARIR